MNSVANALTAARRSSGRLIGDRMFSIHDRPSRLCDGISRRELLRVGGLGGLGLSLPMLLEAQGAAKTQTPDAGGAATFGRAKNVIYLWLQGGPPQHETFDPKPGAPAEIRGEFQPIATNVPGIQFCELLPRLARLADKLIFIRSMVGAKDRHESFQCMTGRLNERNPPGGWPEFGSVISRLQGTADPTLHPYVNLSPKMRHTPYNFGRSSFLGFGHTPFNPLGDIKD